MHTGAPDSAPRVCTGSLYSQLHLPGPSFSLFFDELVMLVQVGPHVYHSKQAVDREKAVAKQDVSVWDLGLMTLRKTHLKDGADMLIVAEMTTGLPVCV